MDSHWRPPGFGEGRPVPSSSTPSTGPRKPRLVKQRKQGSASRPQSAGSALPGSDVGIGLFPTSSEDAKVSLLREGLGGINLSDGYDLRMGGLKSAKPDVLSTGFRPGMVSAKTSDPGISDPSAFKAASFVFGSSGSGIGVGKDGNFKFGGNSPHFTFGDDVAKEISDPNQSSSKNIDERMASWLPDGMQRLTIDSARESGNEDGKVSGSQTSTSGTGTFVSKGGIDATLSEQLSKLKVGISGYSNTAEASTSYNPGINGEKQPVYSHFKTFSLPEEMSKLKLEVSHDIQEERSSHDHLNVGKKNTFVFGAGPAGFPDAPSMDARKLNINTSGINTQAVGSCKDRVEVNDGSFVVPTRDPMEARMSSGETDVHSQVKGSKVKMMDDYATTLSEKGSATDQTLLSNLYNDIRKLNISSTGIVAEKMEHTDGFNVAAKLNSATDTSKPGCFEDVRKSTAENFKSGSQKGKKVVHPSSQVDGRNNTGIFESNKSTTGGFGVNPGTGFPERLSGFNFVNEPMSQLTKDGGLNQGRESFVFGGSAETQSSSTLNNAASSDTDMLTKLPDELGRLNIRPPVELGSAKEVSQCNRSAEPSSFMFSASSSSCLLQPEKSASGFTFQARNFEGGSVAGNMMSSDMPIHSSRGPSRTSSIGLDFSSGSTAFAFMGSGGIADSSMDYHKSKGSSWVPLGSGFPGIHPELSATKKTGSVKNVKSNKKKVKGKKPAAKKDTVFMEKESEPQDDSELISPRSCSPMDVSPYQETVTSDPCSREASVSSDGLLPGHNTCSSEFAQRLFCDNDVENLVSSTQSMVINEHTMNLEQNDGARSDLDPSFDMMSSVEMKPVLEPSIRSKIHPTENISSGNAKACDLTGNISVTHSLDTEYTDNQVSESKLQFIPCSKPDDSTSSKFTFSASSPYQASALPSKRLIKKKNLMKLGSDPISSSLNEKFTSISPPMSFTNLDDSKRIDLTQKPDSDVGVPSVSKIEEKKFEVKKDLSASEAVKKSSSETRAALEACEKWRLRGNQAYASGDLSKAEEYYTRGVDCAISQSEKCKNCPQALKLCYSNRAAARMSLERIREALSDCKNAIAIDQSFVKALLRAANCHLALGEAVEAVHYFRKCLNLVNGSNLADKMLDEASHGLQKAQKVLEYIGRCSELLKKNTCNQLTDMLGIVSEALTISPYSEILIEMKANALLVLRKYDEVIKLCEKSKDISERNSSSIGSDDHTKDDGCNCIEHIPEKIWRANLISKSYFYRGKVEEALNSLQKNRLAGPVTDKCGSKKLLSLVSSAQTLQELLRLKEEGNNAFMSGRHAEAVLYYSKALACSTESYPFSAICFCNRAAAYQALGQITDAIADCSLAIALDANYQKAISRRATLHEMIRDYSQAARDLNKLISILEAQSNEKADESGELKIAARNSDDLKRAHKRLATVEYDARKGAPLDMYMILGVVSSSSPSDIKKAYRKAALKHHPDKACQLLAKGDGNDDILWKDVVNEVHKDADYLFKIIGEAYAVLSDPTKRLEYDAEEERFSSKTEYGNTSRTYEDHSTKLDRNASKQQSWSWTSQGSSQKKRPGSSYSNWYFQKGK